MWAAFKINHSAYSKLRTSELIFVDVDIEGFYGELFSLLNFDYNPKFTFFHVLLTVHLSIILAIDQLNVQILVL